MTLKTLMLKESILRKSKLGLLAVAIIAVGTGSMMFAQQSGYAQTNLTANTAGVANHTDSQLSNPWGISFIPGQTFWIANNNGGTSTTYDAQGNKQTTTVVIPGASTNPCNPGCPTGTVANSTAGYFSNGSFLFDTEDGIIATWTGQASAIVSVDNSPQGAVYKGLAMLTNAQGTFLLAANFNSGNIDVFDRNFNPTHLTGNLTDPSLPAGYAPHGVHVIGNLIYVAYAMQDSAKHDPTTGAGLGLVDIFDTEGNFKQTFASGGMLNAPWGVVATPASWGTFSNAIIVGNFGDGKMNAFSTTGTFLGQVSDSSGNVITNAGLWDMVFGAGGTGDPNTMYFTAGGANQTSGLFATLVPAQAAGADFSLNLSAQSISVSPGGSSTLTINSAATGGFNGQIALTCSAAAGLTCAFSPSTISPGSSAAASTLTLSAAAMAPPGGGGYVAMALLPGLGMFGLIFSWGAKSKNGKGKSLVLLAVLALLVASTGFTVACGSSSNHTTTGGGGGQATLTITGTSGAISHSVPVTVTVN